MSTNNCRLLGLSVCNNSNANPVFKQGQFP